MKTLVTVLDKVWLPAFILFLLSLPFIAIPIKRAIERRVIRWFDRVRYKKPRDVSALVEEDLGQSTVFFPVASTLSFVIPACLLALSGTSLPTGIGTMGKPGPVSNAALLGYPLALCVLLTAIYLNYSGRGSRKWKYELVFSALVIGVFSSVLTPPFGGGHFDENTTRSMFRSRTVFLLIVACLLFLVAQPLAHRVVTGLRRETTVVRLFSYIQIQVVWLVFGLFFTPALLYLLLARFHLIPRLARRPILYFRSFSSATSGPAFREIIAPAAHRYGLVEGLAHRTQWATDLQGSIDLGQQAHLSVLPDDHWKDWVRERVRVASLILFDSTSDTAGMTWEIETVLSQMSPDRIAFLYEEREHDSFAKNTLQIRYSLKGKGPREARDTLEAWIKHRLLENHDAIAPPTL